MQKIKKKDTKIVLDFDTVYQSILIGFGAYLASKAFSKAIKKNKSKEKKP
jgi:hypothetical protein